MSAKIDWLASGARRAEIWNPIKYRNGKPELVESALRKPHQWRSPRNVAVCLMGDLFHHRVTHDMFSRVMAVCHVVDRHTYFIITKRPDNMAYKYYCFLYILSRKPYAHVWCGASICTQVDADVKIPQLVCGPAAHRILSLEPLLTAVDLTGRLAGIDWVIVGGESGPKARPICEDWIGDIISHCHAQGVPVFVEQLGSAWASRWNHADSRGADPSEWPADLRYREYPGGEP